MFNSSVSLIWNFYKDGVFYLNHINDLKQNDTISKLSGGGLFISGYLIYGSYIYIVIYFNESRSIVAHYDFDLNEITVVGKALDGFWDYTFRAFYLENEVCLPLEALIEK